MTSNEPLAPQPVTIEQPSDIQTDRALPLSHPVPHAEPVYTTPPVTIEYAAPPRVMTCIDCVNWRPLRKGAPFGQCLLSGRMSHTPLITTDRMNCSQLQA